MAGGNTIIVIGGWDLLLKLRSVAINVGQFQIYRGVLCEHLSWAGVEHLFGIHVLNESLVILSDTRVILLRFALVFRWNTVNKLK